MTDTELRELVDNCRHAPGWDVLRDAGVDPEFLLLVRATVHALAEELLRARELLSFMAEHACTMDGPRRNPCPTDSLPEDTCFACLAERELARRTP